MGEERGEGQTNELASSSNAEANSHSRRRKFFRLIKDERTKALPMREERAARAWQQRHGDAAVSTQQDELARVKQELASLAGSIASLNEKLKVLEPS
jgi:chromosome segregation ATPase